MKDGVAKPAESNGNVTIYIYIYLTWLVASIQQSTNLTLRYSNVNLF